MTKSFTELSERDILALAISLEEEDGRIYGDFADGRRESYPATAKVLEEMQARSLTIAPACSRRIASGLASTSR